MEKDFPLRGIFVSNTYIILDYVDTIKRFESRRPISCCLSHNLVYFTFTNIKKHSSINFYQKLSCLSLTGFVEQVLS